MSKFTHGMNDKRRQLADSLGLKEGEDHLAVNDRLHGLNILRKARISKQDQRQVERNNLKCVSDPDDRTRCDLVVKELNTLYWDIHKDERGRRSHQRGHQRRGRSTRARSLRGWSLSTHDVDSTVSYERQAAHRDHRVAGSKERCQNDAV